jgi:hypothetical protein
MWGRRRGAAAGAPGLGAMEAGTPATAQQVQCPLCGNRFDPSESQACAHCPKLFRSCGMVVCPRCSHEFVKILRT